MSRRFALVIGSTETGLIDGISAAGASPRLLAHTPAADAEIIEYGRPVRAPVTPVSPTGCPTPAVVTRAVREQLGFETLTVDAGTAAPTAAPTVSLGDQPGGDIRQGAAVPNAREVYTQARKLGSSLPESELVVGESIPGGTTTALGVLTALGKSYGVSSSLPDNPTGLKERVVSTGLAAGNISEGDAADEPLVAIEQMGDPMLAVTTGLVVGAAASGTAVTLAGGTQLLAVAALVRALDTETAPAGETSLELATTTFVADDESVDLELAARELGVELTITDPEFHRADHAAFDRYLAGEGKEGAGMGGALMLAARSDIPMTTLHNEIVSCYEEVRPDGP